MIRGKRTSSPRRSFQRVPDLYVREILPEARRLYELAIANVLGHPEDTIRVARAVRRHAAKHADTWLICGMLRWEAEAQIERQRPADAWRAWRKLKMLSPRTRDSYDRFTEGALLFFCGRIDEARGAYESALAASMERGVQSGFHLLFRVLNSDKSPPNVHRVTLAHIYDKLGWSLDRWPGWSSFVRSLSQPLLRAASVRAKDLASDPRLLRKVAERIDEVRRERVWTGVSRGEEDVVNSAEEVERWQTQMAETLRSFDDDLVGHRAEIDERMRKYFGVRGRPTER